ncbi:MAG: hypothetical protein WC825_12660 [Gallionellaceae bacterium]|jgi:hypothetical protein
MTIGASSILYLGQNPSNKRITTREHRLAAKIVRLLEQGNARRDPKSADENVGGKRGEYFRDIYFITATLLLDKSRCVWNF